MDASGDSRRAITENDEEQVGVRTALLQSYEVSRYFYATAKLKGSAARRMGELGAVIWYSLEIGYTSRRKRTAMDVNALVGKWAAMIVGLAVAHDKDEADRYEAAVEECLVPILAAPIRQIREFYPKLLERLKDDKRVPYLVWRSYEVWIELALKNAPDEDIKQLKTDIATEIAALVELDVKEQIPQALIRALQWRSGETLAEVKEAVIKTQKAGGKVRLRGRESCLFMEVGGTESEPEVCVQI